MWSFGIMMVGILVTWDVCPDHRYDIRWRSRSETPANPFNWPTTANAGDSGYFDIRQLTNNQRYIVQIRPVHVRDNVFDEGSWTDDYLGHRGGVVICQKLRATFGF